MVDGASFLKILKILSFLIISCQLAYCVGIRRPSFAIDYANDTFVRDGEPFRYISGTMHYLRTPHYYWRDRLMKMRAAGFNAVQTYIFWNAHEPLPGVYKFDGQQDLETFVKIAQECGLVVILRGIPYSCAEWDFGGLPAWILRDYPEVVIRTMDQAYIKPLDRWLDVLLPKVEPLLYKNGGPIITVQVENEYGSYFACDHTYMRYLRHKLVSHLGNDVVLFTTDGDGIGFLKCGTLEGVYSTVDFGVTYNPQKAFSIQRLVEPHGPLVNSEFYVGWMDHWGDKHTNISAVSVAKSLDMMLAYGANVNSYVFAGGSSFGFWNGANYPPFKPVLTSYDFDGVLTEAGDITVKYHAIREVISKYNPLPAIPIPPDTTKFAYGKVLMKNVGSLYELLPKLCKKNYSSPQPMTMERLEQYQGFTLYQHKLTTSCDTCHLSIPGIRDRAYISLNKEPVGILQRDQNTTISLRDVKEGTELNILVENQGHINHGPGMVNNSKGIIGDVKLDHVTLEYWTMSPIDLDNFHPEQILNYRNTDQGPDYANIHSQSTGNYSLPTFFIGQFTVKGEPMDTYLDPRPFTKGQAFINSENVGRYWPVRGPQVTLFVPKGFLQTGINYVTFLELEHIPLNTSCSFTDIAYINKPVHGVGNSEELFKEGDTKLLFNSYLLP